MGQLYMYNYTRRRCQTEIDTQVPLNFETLEIRINVCKRHLKRWHIKSKIRKTERENGESLILIQRENNAMVPLEFPTGVASSLKLLAKRIIYTHWVCLFIILKFCFLWAERGNCSVKAEFIPLR